MNLQAISRELTAHGIEHIVCSAFDPNAFLDLLTKFRRQEYKALQSLVLATGMASPLNRPVEEMKSAGASEVRAALVAMDTIASDIKSWVDACPEAFTSKAVEDIDVFMIKLSNHAIEASVNFGKLFPKPKASHKKSPDAKTIFAVYELLQKHWRLKHDVANTVRHESKTYGEALEKVARLYRSIETAIAIAEGLVVAD